MCVQDLVILRPPALFLIAECSETNAAANTSTPSKPNPGSELIETGSRCQANHGGAALRLALKQALTDSRSLGAFQRRR